MRRQRPSVLDLTRLDVERLGVALREFADVAAAAPYRVVLDLGPRRVLAAEVVEALLAAHRAIAGAGGRSAVVVGPALAAQLAVAYPEGITFAADAAAGLVALGGDDPSAAVEVVRGADGVLLRVAGVLDVRGLRAVQPVLDDLPAITGAVVIDLRRVAFADVAGLRAVLRAAEELRAGGAQVRVDGASPAVGRVASRLGWQAYFSSSGERVAEGLRSSALRDAIRRELTGRQDADRWAVIATDLAGRVTHWNHVAERLYGWTRSEVLGRPITELTVGPADRQFAEEIMRAVQDAGSWEGDFEVSRRDGSTFTAHVRDSVVVDAHGRTVGLLGISESARQGSARLLQAA